MADQEYLKIFEALARPARHLHLREAGSASAPPGSSPAFNGRRLWGPACYSLTFFVIRSTLGQEELKNL